MMEPTSRLTGHNQSFLIKAAHLFKLKESQNSILNRSTNLDHEKSLWQKINQLYGISCHTKFEYQAISGF